MKKTSLLLICILFFRTAFPQVSIDHVEPPCWWAGMKTNPLQLMIHGKNISKLKPSFDYKGVSLKSVTGSGNDYLFVDLSIGSFAKPGTITINFKANEKDSALISYKYELKARLILRI
jgi:hypothetical protein